jgi:hypothetical protein
LGLFRDSLIYSISIIFSNADGIDINSVVRVYVLYIDMNTCLSHSGALRFLKIGGKFHIGDMSLARARDISFEENTAILWS